MALHKPEHRTVMYWIYYPMICGIYVLLLPYALVQGRYAVGTTTGRKMKWNWRLFREVEDWIDDPIDWLKYKLFGIGTLP